MPRYSEQATQPMSDEDWIVNKDCDLAKRTHKWQWKFDIAAGVPSMTEAFCVYCGKETRLARDDSGRTAGA